MMELTFIILGIVCLVIGFLGCILPSLPGPPLTYCALLLLHFSQTEPVFSLFFLIAFACAVIIVSVLDFLIPLVGVKMYGASKYGIWGSLIGMIVGLIFFPPFGMIFGILIGAICGELMAGRSSGTALKTGFVSFAATVSTMFLKLAISSVLTFYFILTLIQLFT